MAKKVKKTSKKTYTRHSALSVIGKVLKGFVIFTLLVVMVGSVYAGSIVLGIAKSAPEADIEKFLALSAQSVLLDDQEAVMDTVISNEVRIPIQLAEMGQTVQNAFVSSEDERFFDHKGVDIKRTIGVTAKYLWSKVVGGNYSQGGSTMTQQLIKNTFLTSAKEESRKIKEMYMALQIEKEVPKEKILETYLNSIFLGGRAYGVEAAARQYFSKSAKDLTVIEAAYLAGVTPAPSEFYAFSEENLADPSSIENNTKTVLDQMAKNGYITEAELQQYRDEITNNGITFTYTTLANGGKYNYEYFTRPAVLQVTQDLMDKLGLTEEEANEKILMGGLKIYTTMNRSMQEYSEGVISDPDNYLFEESIDANNIVQPQVATVITEPATGHIKTVVGGRGEQVIGGPNRAVSSNFLRAVGSSTKPLTVYAPGIDKKIFDAATVFEDSPLSKEQRVEYFAGDSGSDASDPRYPGNAYFSWMGYVNVRDALEVSSNLVAIKAAMLVGSDVSKEYAEKFGFVLPPEEYRGLSMYALGQYANIDGKDGANPLIMASAFGSFANNGFKNKSVYYTKVVDPAGNVVLENQPAGEQVVQPGTAYIMWDLLKSVVDHSVPGNEWSDDIQVAGKTGTTSDNRELWFVGTTTRYSAAIFIGHDDHSKVIDANSGGLLGSTRGTATVFRKIMEFAHEGKEAVEPAVPDSIVEVAVSHDSGTLPTSLTRNDPRGDRTVYEYFFKDRVPTEFDNVHVAVEVNRLTGKLATSRTPSYLRVRRVYIVRDYEPEVPLEDDEYVLPRAFDDYVVPPVTKPTNTRPTATTTAQTWDDTSEDTTPEDTTPEDTTPEDTTPTATKPPNNGVRPNTATTAN